MSEATSLTMTAATNVPSPRKRLIMCCDGTWMNSDGKLQTPSNVTRISRAFKKVCHDGTLQIIEYQSGVGTGSTLADMFTGGAFGIGIEENIRQAYSFLCANYNDGDEIILVGFSRGAFTARSVAGMVGDLGLLTQDGMECFYPIFKDMENWHTPFYHLVDPYPNKPFDNKPWGQNVEQEYRQKLLERGLTRVYQSGDKKEPIKIKAVGVWDTVGSLGIPNVSWLQKLGIHGCTNEYRFYDTNLSDRIEHAFQALALDEHRPPFSPAVWERDDRNRNTTELRQVWFPGNHGNVGGGWDDSGVANMSLAWMMDQLASVGVEFDENTIPRIYSQLERYYRESGQPDSDDIMKAMWRGFLPAAFCNCLPFRHRRPRNWAVTPIYTANAPVRPWALGKIQQVGGLYYKVLGHDKRTPGRYHRVNSANGRPTRALLQDTNERIHSSVRVRMAAGGLGLDDKAVWDAPALKGLWRLRKTTKNIDDPISRATKTWEPVLSADSASEAQTSSQRGKIGETTASLQRPLSPESDGGEDGRHVWQYSGPERGAPLQRTLVEEPLGPYERQLLRLSGGTPNVYQYAQTANVGF